MLKASLVLEAGMPGKRYLLRRGSRGRPRSSLRQPGLAHPVADALALSQIARIVARRPRAEAGDGESGIEGKPGLNRGPRLIGPAKMRQGGGEIKMHEWGNMSVGLDGSPKRADRSIVVPEV